MRTLKIKSTLLSILLAVTTLSLASTTSENEMGSTMDLFYFEEYFEFQEFTKSLDMAMIPETEVKVYDQNGDLLATGGEEDTKIKSLVRISDLMTEVDGTKYYCLSFKSK
jgi:hypothetical protein